MGIIIWYSCVCAKNLYFYGFSPWLYLNKFFDDFCLSFPPFFFVRNREILFWVKLHLLLILTYINVVLILNLFYTYRYFWWTQYIISLLQELPIKIKIYQVEDKFIKKDSIIAKLKFRRAKYAKFISKFLAFIFKRYLLRNLCNK